VRDQLTVLREQAFGAAATGLDGNVVPLVPSTAKPKGP
jgi:hypothetical protein